MSVYVFACVCVWRACNTKFQVERDYNHGSLGFLSLGISLQSDFSPCSPASDVTINLPTLWHFLGLPGLNICSIDPKLDKKEFRKSVGKKCKSLDIYKAQIYSKMTIIIWLTKFVFCSPVYHNHIYYFLIYDLIYPFLLPKK